MKLLKFLSGPAMLVGLLIGTGGCELIVSPDRSKIEPTGGGGAGGGPGGTGGGATGGGGTGGTECTPEDDNKECTDDVCNDDGTTAHTPKAAGEACAENGGAVCNDAGECVACLDNTQCTSPQYCNDKNQCVDPTCDDGLVNGSETDEDCGGADCAPCADGELCAVESDCESGVCKDGGSGALTCAAPACGDGVMNGDDGCDDGNLTDGDGCDSNCKPTGCGNGVTAGAEECDDANTDNGDGCDNNCTVTACGNNVVTTGEVCDDGNLDDGDGCDSNCTTTECGNDVVTAGEACDDGNLADDDGCDSNCTVTACGNGVTTTGEVCDDGNLDDGDGCDSNCTTTECGNGIPTGIEACDDGNATDGDGCDNNCTLTNCGNGVTTAGELCDDGNLDDGDGCDSNCTVSGCGNGVTAGAEACDDGNTVNGDGCDNNCTVTACGNGVTAGAEACDDGNTVDGDGCDANCTISGCGNGVTAGTEACDDGNTVNGDGCDNNCTVTACGNGITAGTEACDDGNTVNGDGCDDNCTATACGNGVTTGTEACDDGNAANGDGCDNNCTVTACGNGVVTAGEACDDGNVAGGDCCDAACQVELGCETEPNNACGSEDGPLALPALFKAGIGPVGDVDFFSFTLPGPGVQSIKLQTFSGSAPGACASIDTVLELRGSDCATILTSNDDGGIPNCSLIDGAATPAAAKLAPGTYYARVNEYGNNAAIAQYNLQVIVLSTCGNGVVEPTEKCDDANITGGDGCSSTCLIEPGFHCQGTAPSLCAPNEVNCNDGIDNNGAFGADAADPTCAIPAYFPPCGAGQSLLVVPNAPGAAIPDNSTTGVTSNVTVSGAGTIARAAVTYHITHEFDADVDISLLTPAPGTIDVCSDNGSTGLNFVNTVLDTTCATSVTTGTAPFTGCYIPESPGQVTALSGTSANGTWGLKVVDDALNDTGTFHTWALVLCTTTCGDGVVAGVEACDDGNTTPGDGCSATCTTEAGYTCMGGGPGSCADIDECMAGAPCDANATCTNTPGSFTCACDAGYTGTGLACTHLASCKDILADLPASADGDYLIDPDGLGAAAPFTVRCDMTTAGGGWTLAFNDGPAFDSGLFGGAAETGYATNYINLAYSTVPITSDVMIDASDADIVMTSQESRAVIAGVPATTMGSTMRDVFQGSGLFFYDAEDNTNVATSGLTCGAFGKWSDYESALCTTTVLASNDASGCSPDEFELGIESSHTVDAANCAGWPQDPNYGGTNFWPDNFRIWVR